jgi:hypothetical protein
MGARQHGRLVAVQRGAVTQHRYRGEVWIDEAGEANFRFHIAGGSFGEAREALARMIGVMQDRLDNAERCPFYEPPLPSQARRVEAAFGRYEAALAGLCVDATRRKMDALIHALINAPARRHHPAVSLLAGAVVAWRIFKTIRKAVR